MVYIITITLQDGRSLIQGIFGSKTRADKEAARIQEEAARIEDEIKVYVTETLIID